MESRRNLRLSVYDSPLEYRSACAAQIVRHSRTMEPHRGNRQHRYYVPRRRRKKREDHRCKWKDCCKCCTIIWKCLTSIWTSLGEFCCRSCRGPREEPQPPCYSGPSPRSTSTNDGQEIELGEFAV